MLNINISTQPDDETCGPTSLHAIYHYYQDNISLQQVVKEVEYLPGGGTIAALLGKHALKRNYKSTLYIYNIEVFDPSWFKKRNTDNHYLIDKLTTQLKYKKNERLVRSSKAYIEYLELGGKVMYKNLTIDLLKKMFRENTPILTGLSATYLYNSMRERSTIPGKIEYDDIRGEPTGHFVVLCGYDEKHRLIVVADPHRENPISKNNYYKVHLTQLINAILLGVLTNDANLLIIQPNESHP